MYTIYETCIYIYIHSDVYLYDIYICVLYYCCKAIIYAFSQVYELYMEQPY